MSFGSSLFDHFLFFYHSVAYESLLVVWFFLAPWLFKTANTSCCSRKRPAPVTTGGIFKVVAYESFHCIQLFRERLSEKVHATIPKGIVGGFEFTVLSKKFERMAREVMDMCLRLLKESNKVGSIATMSGTAYCSYPILPFGIVACTFFRQPFSK